MTEQEWASQFKGHSVKIDKKVDEFLMYAKLHPGPQARNELDKQASEIVQELKGVSSFLSLVSFLSFCHAFLYPCAL